MDAIQAFLEAVITAIKANIAGILLAVGGGAGGVLVAFITRSGVKDTNDVARRKIDVDVDFKERELTTAEQARLEERKLTENQLIYKQQQDLYDQTHKLIAALEHRLEVQSRQAHEEREVLTKEIHGLRRTVVLLERRVSQLVFAFRSITGQDPPPPEEYPDDKE